MPKGEQKCEQGSWWDMLQGNELVESCKEWERKCHSSNDQFFLLDVPICFWLKYHFQKLLNCLEKLQM